MVPPQEAHPLFLDVGATELNHDEILKHMGMDFVPYPYQRSLATSALKGMDPERRNLHAARRSDQKTQVDDRPTDSNSTL